MPRPTKTAATTTTVRPKTTPTPVERHQRRVMATLPEHYSREVKSHYHPSRVLDVARSWTFLRLNELVCDPTTGQVTPLQFERGMRMMNAVAAECTAIYLSPALWRLTPADLLARLHTVLMAEYAAIQAAQPEGVLA